LATPWRLLVARRGAHTSCLPIPPHPFIPSTSFLITSMAALRRLWAVPGGGSAMFSPEEVLSAWSAVIGGPKRVRSVGAVALPRQPGRFRILEEDLCATQLHHAYVQGRSGGSKKPRAQCSCHVSAHYSLSLRPPPASRPLPLTSAPVLPSPASSPPSLLSPQGLSSRASLRSLAGFLPP
jgi:hypothetical protein